MRTIPHLAPGAIGELEIDLWSISLIVNKGHNIGLHVSSSSSPRCEVNPNTGADLPDYTGKTPEGDFLLDPASLHTANHTVHFDAARPSALILPIPRTP